MKRKTSFLLVDGYNIVFSWDKLKELAASNLESARIALLDMMCNLSGYTEETVIVVFDAHHVNGGVGSEAAYSNIWVVFTKEAQTADHYIEQAVSRFEKSAKARVATSDALEQVIIMAKGAIRVSSSELFMEMTAAQDKMRTEYKDKRGIKKGSLYDRLDKNIADWLEDMRRQ